MFNTERHFLVPQVPTASNTEGPSAAMMDATAASILDCAETTTVIVDNGVNKHANLETSTDTSSLQPTTISYISESFYTFLPKPISSDNEGSATIIDASMTEEGTKSTTDPYLPEPISCEDQATTSDTRSFSYLLPETPTSTSGEPTFTILPTDVDPTFTILPIDLDPTYTILPTTDVESKHQAPAPVTVSTVTVYASDATTSGDDSVPTDTTSEASEEYTVERTMAYIFGILALAVVMV